MAFCPWPGAQWRLCHSMTSPHSPTLRSMGLYSPPSVLPWRFIVPSPTISERESAANSCSTREKSVGMTQEPSIEDLRRAEAEAKRELDRAQQAFQDASLEYYLANAN